MMCGDSSERMIDMRQMIDSHVANKGAFDGGIAQTAMDPAQENAKLRQQRKSNDQPIRILRCESQNGVIRSAEVVVRMFFS
jgi:hypothetical protein